MSYRNKKIVYGLYDDEEVMIDAIRKANNREMAILDVFTPFPVHGLDDLLHLSESRLHIGGFIYGMIGTLTAVLGMSWIHAMDWPNIFGGKPYWAIASFIPITFEVTVLFAAIGMTVTFYIINGQGPGIMNPVVHPRITDDKFCIAFDADNASEEDVTRFESFFDQTGASFIETKKL